MTYSTASCSVEGEGADLFFFRFAQHCLQQRYLGAIQLAHLLNQIERIRRGEQTLLLLQRGIQQRCRDIGEGEAVMRQRFQIEWTLIRLFQQTDVALDPAAQLTRLPLDQLRLIDRQRKWLDVADQIGLITMQCENVKAL